MKDEAGAARFTNAPPIRIIQQPNYMMRSAFTMNRAS
jgi:hypothetical protein